MVLAKLQTALSGSRRATPGSWELSSLRPVEALLSQSTQLVLYVHIYSPSIHWGMYGSAKGMQMRLASICRARNKRKIFLFSPACVRHQFRQRRLQPVAPTHSLRG